MNTASNGPDTPLDPLRLEFTENYHGSGCATPDTAPPGWRFFRAMDTGTSSPSKGGLLIETTAASVLTENHGLYGPAKYVTGADGALLSHRPADRIRLHACAIVTTA